jgi:DNA topoisomerase IB
LNRSGKQLRNKQHLERIRKLAIPPAYNDVWICANPHGHIQATGRDARGRKQYRYHTDWRTTRDAAKFDRMVDFGLALPRLRKRLQQVLRQKQFSRDKVVAVVITLLDRTRVRIGNEEYARSNKSFGLTTLRNRHVKFIHHNQVLLHFRGKGGIDHEVSINDRRLVKIVRQLQELPGQYLFQYVDENGECHRIDSTMVNDYLHSVMGHDFTAKDFRTWNATVRAIELLATTTLPDPPTEHACKACINAIVKQVAQDLRNTPAVCRKSYINPGVFTAWREGRLAALTGDPSDRCGVEKNALHLLKSLAKHTPHVTARHRQGEVVMDRSIRSIPGP